MKINSRFTIGAVTGAAMLIGSIATASAAVVCNGDTCWHAHTRYAYPPAAHIVVHPDTWHWGPHVVIREHEGRGYWRGHDWVAF